MKGKRIFRILILSASLGLALWLALTLWTEHAEAGAHYTPECAKADLGPILQKGKLASADYVVLFQQTGMARAGVDELYASGRQWMLLGLQERFLAEAEVECSCGDFFIRSERLTDFREVVHDGNMAGMPESPDFYFLPTVQNGDILITFSGHIFGWRSGHAAIVVDARERLTLEAIMPGCDSRICSLDEWREYPGFALFRLRGASEEERARIADYARECLTGLPYRLTAFAGMDGIEEAGTQCAHLVWYAYRHFGYDLDSDGGFVVTPGDLYRSDLLELIQIYGLSPD